VISMAGAVAAWARTDLFCGKHALCDFVLFQGCFVGSRNGFYAAAIL
jgi:hypothetical protein